MQTFVVFILPFETKVAFCVASVHCVSARLAAYTLLYRGAIYKIHAL